MKRAVTFLVSTVLMMAGCGSTGQGEANAICASVLDFDGKRFSGAATTTPILGEKLGRGVLPGCDDGGGEAPDREVTVHEIRGVDTDTAVAVSNDVYVDENLPADQWPEELLVIRREQGDDQVQPTSNGVAVLTGNGDREGDSTITGKLEVTDGGCLGLDSGEVVVWNNFATIESSDPVTIKTLGETHSIGDKVTLRGRPLLAPREGDLLFEAMPKGCRTEKFWLTFNPDS